MAVLGRVWKLCTSCPNLALCISSIQLFLSCSLYNKPVPVSVLLNFVSLSSKLPNLRRGSWEPPIYNPSVRSMGGPGLAIGV